MGSAYGMHGRLKKGIQDFGEETYRKETVWQTAINGRIILKCILNRMGTQRLNISGYG
jgi:hypothetical protein